MRTVSLLCFVAMFGAVALSQWAAAVGLFCAGVGFAALAVSGWISKQEEDR